MDGCCINYQATLKWQYLHLTDIGYYSLKIVVQHACIHRDQAHSSSVPRTRPDAAICKNGAVVLKHEAKAVANDLDEAEEDLVDKLFPEALKQFPQGSEEILGIITCAS
jgi:hypothetical protein